VTEDVFGVQIMMDEGGGEAEMRFVIQELFTKQRCLRPCWRIEQRKNLLSNSFIELLVVLPPLRRLAAGNQLLRRQVDRKAVQLGQKCGQLLGELRQLNGR